MTDEIDQLKALKADERENLSTGYVFFNSLEEARAHQRGEYVPPPKPKFGNAKRKFNDAQIYDMIHSHDPLSVIAKRHQTSKQTVSNVRYEYRTK